MAKSGYLGYLPLKPVLLLGKDHSFLGDFGVLYHNNDFECVEKGTDGAKTEKIIFK